MHRVASVADHERARLDPAALGARRGDAAEEESLEDRRRRRRVLADPVEADVREVIELMRLNYDRIVGRSGVPEGVS